MMKAARAVRSLLFCGALLAAPAADAEWLEQRPRPLALALSAGTYLFFVHEAGVEVVVADRIAIGAKAVYFPGPSAETHVFPSVAIGSRRSRSSAGYVALTWVPGSTSEAFGGTLGAGYERAFAGGARVYGEAGLLGGAGDEGSIFLPSLLIGLRLRF
jgi:hypothetical protein